MSDAEEFFEALSSSYGQMESVMGSEAYTAFLKSRQAEQQAILAIADRNRAWSNLIRMVALIGLVMAIPVTVWLWRWAV